MTNNEEFMYEADYEWSQEDMIIEENIIMEDDINFDDEENFLDEEAWIMQEPEMELTINSKTIKNDKIKNKKTKSSTIDETFNINQQELEKLTIIVLCEYYFEDTPKIISELRIKEDYFLTSTWNFLFRCLVDFVNDKWKIDTNLLINYANKIKNNLHPNEAKHIDIKKFFQWEWFYKPKKELLEDYIIVLAKNYKKDSFLKLNDNLRDALIRWDESDILSIKAQIAEFDFNSEDWDKVNPDLWLMTQDYLSDQYTEYINWGYLTNKTRLKTWFYQIDEVMWWVEVWNYVIFAARPSVWKSVNLLNVMRSMIHEWHRCIYISAEMYWRYLYSRWLSMEVNISQEKIKNPSKLSQAEKNRLEKYNENFKNNDKAFFYYNSKIKPRDIENIIREVENKHWKVNAIFVDYITKIEPNENLRNKSTNDIVTSVSKDLFWIWGKFWLVVFTASQLNRESIKWADIPWLIIPKLSDLRDSGAIEQDADIVIWLTRNTKEAEVFTSENEKQDFIWTVLKNRNGKIWEYSFDYYPTTFILKDKVEEVFIDNTKTNNKPKTKLTNADKKEISEELLSESQSIIDMTQDLFG